MAAAFAAARVVLLGESHDNPWHHRGEAWALRRLVEQGRHPVVALEMLTTAEAQAVGRCHQDACSVAELTRAVGWNERGWPDWRIYEPVLAEIVDAGLVVLPASLPRPLATELAVAGNRSGDYPFVDRLGLAEPLPEPARAQMAAEIREAHCGHAPEDRLPTMIQVQRVRDGFMADTLAAAQTGATAVLLAGAGHVRTDRGVPVQLAKLVPGLSMLSIGFLETVEGQNEPRAYLDASDSAVLPFTFVWFTEPVDTQDPCEKYREQLQKLR